MTDTINFGSFFVGIGLMVFSFAIAYMFYQIARMFKSSSNKEARFDLFEELILDDLAKSKGIDLERAAVERRIVNSKSIRRKIEEEMIKKMFDEKQEVRK